MKQSRSNEQIKHIQELAGEKLDELLEYFGVRDTLSRGGKSYNGPCPIHESDGERTVNIYYRGDTIGNWVCRSNGCHRIFKSSLIGLVRGLLSKQKLGWTKTDGAEENVFSFYKTVSFLASFVGVENVSDIEIDQERVSQNRLTNQIEYIYSDIPPKTIEIPPDTLKNSLEIPAPYFLSRQYSPEILAKFDVGFCPTYGKQMYLRSVVPVYNNDKTFVIGCTGRSIFEACELCGAFHNPTKQCPPKEIRHMYAKWRINSGFAAEKHVYNLWNAQEYIRKSKTALLVESPNDVWRLEEAGIHNSIAMFGAHMTPDQRNLIDMSGAMNLVILFDPDSAGREGTADILKNCSDLYRVYTPQVCATDIGDATPQQLQKTLLPYLREINT